MKKWCAKCRRYIPEPSASEISKYAKFWTNNKCYYCDSILINQEDKVTITSETQSDKDNRITSSIESGSIIKYSDAKPFKFSSGESVITLKELILVANKYPRETEKYLLNDTLANWLWSIGEKESANFAKILRIRYYEPFVSKPSIFETFLSFISTNDPLKRAEMHRNYSRGLFLDEVNVTDGYLIEHLLIGMDHATILTISQNVSKNNLMKVLKEFEVYEASIKTKNIVSKNKVFKLRTGLFRKNIRLTESDIKRLMSKLNFILNSAARVSI
jgi:hypothetical protein